MTLQSEATVTFDTSGYGEPRAVTVSEIRVVNAPSGADGDSVIHRKHQRCNAGGRGRSELDGHLRASDVVAQVDASAAEH